MTESTLTAENITQVKSRGFLRNRGTDCFSGRVVVAGGVYSSGQLQRIAECASLYGNGTVAFTSRLCAEIVGLPFDRLDDADAFLQGDDSGLSFGGTGNKIRPVTACKGTTCVFGCCDTQKIARQLHEAYYLGKQDLALPHKFKIGVGGCGNSCMKPSLNDFGIEGRRRKGETVFQIYLGGTWGRTTRIGTPLAKLVREEELFPLLDGVLHWYQTNAQPKERLGAAIDRLGMEHLESALGAYARD